MVSSITPIIATASFLGNTTPPVSRLQTNLKSLRNFPLKTRFEDLRISYSAF